MKHNYTDCYADGEVNVFGEKEYFRRHDCLELRAANHRMFHRHVSIRTYDNKWYMVVGDIDLPVVYCPCCGNKLHE